MSREFTRLICDMCGIADMAKVTKIVLTLNGLDWPLVEVTRVRTPVHVVGSEVAKFVEKYEIYPVLRQE